MKTKHLQSVGSGKRVLGIGKCAARKKPKEDPLLAMFMVLMDMVAQADGPQMFEEGIPDEYPGVKKISKIADLAHKGMEYLITHPDFRSSYDKAVQIVGNVGAGYPTYPFTYDEFVDEDEEDEDEEDEDDDDDEDEDGEDGEDEDK